MYIWLRDRDLEDVPRGEVRLVGQNGPVDRIVNLQDPTLRADQCVECGKAMRPGDWPWCPHGREVGYGFRGDFR